MNILMLHTSFGNSERKNVLDSIYCFERYTTGHRFFYLDVQEEPQSLAFLAKIPFDAVIFHYSFLSKRNATQQWAHFYEEAKEYLAAIPGYKIAIPQDENYCVAPLRTLFKDCSVEHVFTIASPNEYDLLYPRELTGGTSCSTVHPGYIDEESLKQIDLMAQKVDKRDIDIGYRARKLPYWAGSHGQMKTDLAIRFNTALEGCSGWNIDIKNTGKSDENTFWGDSWYAFLLCCRTTLGCVGGGSLLDIDGSIVKKVEAYCEAHPQASFEETEAACFPGQDNSIHYYCLGPRHFECAMTKTCQVLVEGDYFGVFKPGVHYIELKKDYSNLEDVLTQIQDVEHCERIAQKCYDDVVALPGKENPNTYAWFANHVIGHIENHIVRKCTFRPWHSLCFICGKWAYRQTLKAVKKSQQKAILRDKRRVAFYRFFDNHPGSVRLIKRILDVFKK